MRNVETLSTVGAIIIILIVSVGLFREWVGAGAWWVSRLLRRYLAQVRTRKRAVRRMKGPAAARCGLILP